MEERKKFLTAIRKDNICGKEDEPLAMLIMGALTKGPNFRKACAFAKLSRNDERAKKWWINLHEGGFITSKRVYFNPESENSGIEFALALNIGKGYIKMKHD